MLTVSRVVVLLSPLFVALSGYVVTQAARLPGAPKLDAGELTVVFVAGATAAGGAVVTWLHNRGKHERQLEAAQQDIERARAWEDEPAEAPLSFEDVLGGLEEVRAQALHAVDALSERMDELEARKKGVLRRR